MDKNRYSIKTVARLSGVPADTLRNWERRYHFLTPKRNERGVRFYSSSDVELIKKIVALTLTGERVGDIAEKIRKGELLSATSTSAKKVSDEIQNLIEEFYDALLSVDCSKIDHLHDNLKASLSFTQMLEFVYSPVFERLDNDHRSGKVGSAEANFGVAFVRQILFSFLSSSSFRAHQHRRTISCATLPGDFHEKNLMMISAHLKYRGWGVYYLGCNVSSEEICRFSRMTGSAVYLSVSDKTILEREMQSIRSIKTPVFLGGSAVQAHKSNESVLGDLHFIDSMGTSAVENVIKLAESYQR
jgi:MerR family transcriptional regulator, light-induced transcriptional regulator